MNKFIKTSLLVSASMLVGGFFLVGFGFLFGGRPNFGINRNFELVKYGDNRKNIVLEKTKVEGEIKALDIKTEFADVEIIESDEFAVEYKYINSTKLIEDIQYDVKNGVLTFTDQNRNNDGGNFMFLNFNWGFGSNAAENYVKIYVPAGVTLNQADIQNNSGKIDITDINAETFMVRNDFGEITLENIICKKGEVISDSGDISINNFEGDDVTVENDFGTIDITKMLVTILFVDNDSGKTIINESKVSEMVTIENNFGKFEADSLIAHALFVDNNSGDVVISNSEVYTLDVNMDFGSIDVDLKGNAADYDYELETEFGNVLLNGQKQGNSCKFVNGKDKKITIENESGNIDVDVE